MARPQAKATARWAGAVMLVVAAVIGPVTTSAAQPSAVVTIAVAPDHPSVGGQLVVSGTCAGAVVVVDVRTATRPGVVVTPFLTVAPDSSYTTTIDLPADLDDGFTVTATCGRDPDTALGSASVVVTYAQPPATSTTAPPATVAPAVSGAPAFTG